MVVDKEGSMHYYSNLDRFLDCTTPVVPSHFLPKVHPHPFLPFFLTPWIWINLSFLFVIWLVWIWVSTVGDQEPEQSMASMGEGQRGVLYIGRSLELLRRMECLLRRCSHPSKHRWNRRSILRSLSFCHPDFHQRPLSSGFQVRRLQFTICTDKSSFRIELMRKMGGWFSGKKWSRRDTANRAAMRARAIRCQDGTDALQKKEGLSKKAFANSMIDWVISIASTLRDLVPMEEFLSWTR